METSVSEKPLEPTAPRGQGDAVARDKSLDTERVSLSTRATGLGKQFKLLYVK